MEKISRNVYTLPVPEKPKIMPSPLHVEHTKNALDFFAVPESPVFAALDGIVIDKKDSYRRGGPESKYAGCYNFILLKHKFGEHSHYVHLQNRSVVVRSGQRVSAGQIIARTGETGFTSYPHLHFGIFRYDKDENIISLKPRVRSDNGEIILESPNRFIDQAVLRAYWFVKNGNSVVRRGGILTVFSSKTLADEFIIFNRMKNAKSFYLTPEEAALMIKKISPTLLVDGKYIVDL